MKLTNKFQLQLTSSNNSIIQNTVLFFLYTFVQNKIYNLKIQKIQLPLKIKKFTLLKSPHVFKTAYTQLEIRELKKLIIIKNFSTIKELQVFSKILVKLVKNIPTTVRLKIKNFKLLYI
jgi:ribosomal protein S10